MPDENDSFESLKSSYKIETKKNIEKFKGQLEQLRADRDNFDSTVNAAITNFANAITNYSSLYNGSLQMVNSHQELIDAQELLEPLAGKVSTAHLKALEKVYVTRYEQKLTLAKSDITSTIEEEVEDEDAQKAFKEKLNKRIEDIRTTIEQMVTDALSVDDDDCQYYYGNDLSQCTQEMIEEAIAQNLEIVDEKIDEALENLAKNVKKAHILFEKYRKILISFQEEISTAASYKAPFEDLSCNINQLKEYIIKQLGNAFIQKGDDAQILFNELEGFMRVAVEEWNDRFEKAKKGLSSSSTYDETTSEERDDIRYASEQNESFNFEEDSSVTDENHIINVVDSAFREYNNQLESIATEIRDKIDSDVQDESNQSQAKTHLADEINHINGALNEVRLQILKPFADVNVILQNLTKSFNAMLVKLQTKLDNDFKRLQVNDEEALSDSDFVETTEITSEESTAESDDNQVQELPKHLTTGERIKAIEALAKKKPGYSEKESLKNFKHILSELFSPGQLGEDSSESWKETLKASKRQELAAIPAPSQEQTEEREKTKAQLEAKFKKDLELQQYQRDFDAIKQRVDALGNPENPSDNEEILALQDGLEQVESNVEALKNASHGETVSSERKPLTVADQKAEALLKDIRDYKAQLDNLLNDASSIAYSETEWFDPDDDASPLPLTPLETPPDPKAEVLQVLKEYYFALQAHETPDNTSAVSKQLVVTIKTLDPDFNATQAPRAPSPTSITQGPGASEPAAVEQDVMSEQHLALLKQLDEKLEDLIYTYSVQLAEPTQIELNKLQKIVKDSIRAVNQQVMKGQTSALRQSPEDPGGEPTPENRGLQN